MTGARRHNSSPQRFSPRRFSRRPFSPRPFVPETATAPLNLLVNALKSEQPSDAPRLSPRLSPRVSAGLSPRLSLERIRAATAVIDPVFLASPQFVCEPLSDELGVELSLKVETLNPIRSFKGRGAELLAERIATSGGGGSDRNGDGLDIAGARSGEGASEPAPDRASSSTSPPHVVCASAGNFGQALAYACRKRRLSLTVFAATTANELKIARMRRLGAEVIQSGADFDAAKLAAREFAAHATANSPDLRDAGRRLFVEDGAAVETVEGAGTMALEWLAGAAPPDVWLVPLGNGGLLGGVAHVAKSLRPSIKIVAVQAAGAPAMIESWRAGRAIEHESIDTIADGIGVRVPVPESLDDIRGVIDEAMLVSDEQIIAAMRLVHRHLGLVIEPSAAVGVAALLADPAALRGARVGTILCGGNVTPRQMAEWLASR